ncbi:MAG: hypothetical protein D3914_17720, partial [Candidatus Electrothrix sp. LOE2]|nr:hypothetical protein [Candidatus Electrothrix sp. LOE2]
MQSGQMSINKLVIHLELAVLGFVLVVLLLSALDRGGTREPGTAEQQERIDQVHQVQVAGAQSEPQKVEAGRTELVLDVHVPPRQRETWLGDLDGMLQRGQVRILIPFSRTFFFRANDQELGLSSEILGRYKQFLNDQLVLGDQKIKFIFLPTPEERLLEDLLAGKGDIVAAAPALSPEQEKRVAFV